MLTPPSIYTRQVHTMAYLPDSTAAADMEEKYGTALKDEQIACQEDLLVRMKRTLEDYQQKLRERVSGSAALCFTSLRLP